MYHLVEPAADALVDPGDDTALHHTPCHWGTLLVLVQALDVWTWL